jgi:LuxR family maltose regulon positive regulatory protein
MVALFNPGPSERARLLLALGEVQEAADWVAARGLSNGDVPVYPREREYLVLARVLLAQDGPDRALAILERLHDAAVAQARFGSIIEIRALQSLALDAIAEPGRALDALADAIALAQPEGYVRVFIDEGPAMMALLRRLAAAGQRGAGPTLDDLHVRYAERLLGAAPTEPDAVAPAAVRTARGTVLVEALTDREREVLLLLSVGQSNREIADRLVVTLDTVKKHLTHIFGKLGAVSRTQAVARARALHLVD